MKKRFALTRARALVVIAHGTPEQLASGSAKLEFELPGKGPDAEAHYIPFRDPEKKSGSSRPADR